MPHYEKYQDNAEFDINEFRDIYDEAYAKMRKMYYKKTKKLWREKEKHKDDVYFKWRSNYFLHLDLLLHNLVTDIIVTKLKEKSYKIMLQEYKDNVEILLKKVEAFENIPVPQVILQNKITCNTFPRKKRR